VTAVSEPGDGPFYDEMHVGMEFDSPPGVTVDGGLMAAYQSIAGEQLALSLDQRIAEAVTGSARRVVSPGLLMHLSIGASTVATKRVVANLFYRNVRIERPVLEGETLHTRTRVTAMSDSAPRADREPRGKVILSISTTADGEPVLDYERCPLIRLRGETLPGHGDELGVSSPPLDLESYTALVPTGWDLAALGPHQPWGAGDERIDPLRDVVDQATSLVRLTHNQAAIHRDAGQSPYPSRLVYGGHTVALAQASLSRVMPDMATVLGWHSCDHTGPVFEGDLLSFRHRLIDEYAVSGGTVRAVRVGVQAHRSDVEPSEVLDWTVVVLGTRADS
jgi:acyl dehydratase